MFTHSAKESGDARAPACCSRRTDSCNRPRLGSLARPYFAVPCCLHKTLTLTHREFSPSGNLRRVYSEQILRANCSRDRTREFPAQTERGNRDCKACQDRGGVAAPDRGAMMAAQRANAAPNLWEPWKLFCRRSTGYRRRAAPVIEALPVWLRSLAACSSMNRYWSRSRAKSIPWSGC